MCDEILYTRSLNDGFYMSSFWGKSLEIPKLDINTITREMLYHIMLSGHPLSFAGADLGEGNDRCPFIEKGAMAIRWDGDVSPCLPLLHDHKSFMNGYERSLQHYMAGNVIGQDLNDLWNLPEYLVLP